MKKLCLFVVLLASTLGTYAKDLELISKWMLFTGDHSYMNNVVNKRDGFGSGEVTATALMANGNRVFAVADKGIFMWDGKKMQSPKIPGDSYAGMSDIISIACDSKNTIWIGTTQGLVKYDGATFTNIPGSSTHMTVVTDIVVTATDKLYISGMVMGDKELVGAGVSFFNGSDWTNYNKGNSDIADNMVSDLLLDGNNHLWAIPGGKHDMGVVKFDGKNWKQFTNGSGLATNMVSAMATNSTGKVWLGTPKGVMAYDGTNFTMRPFSNGFGIGLARFARDGQLDVTALAMEENGTVWVGTRTMGLFSLRHDGVRLLDQQNSPIVTNAVLNISIDKDGTKWIVAGYRTEEYAKSAPLDNRNRHTHFTSYYGGVTAYKENGKITDPKWTMYDSTTSTLEIGSILSIGEDKDGAIWFPSTADGLVKMNGDKFTVYQSQRLLGNGFTKMYQAADGKIYLATGMGAVRVYENGEVKDYASRPNMGGVTGMTFDKNNVFWVSGQGGISKFTNGEWETFNKKDGLPSIIIYCIIKDSKNTLWAGTAKGLVKYDTAWQEVGADVDFPSNDFTVIREDKAGKLWLGTNKGISIYDGKTFTNISEVEALKIKKFRVNDIFIDKNNVAWIATESYGLLKYDGTNWTVYNKANTGAMYDKVDAVFMASDGKLYVSSQTSSMNEFDVNLPSQNAEELQRQEISKKIKMAEPKRLLTVLQP